LNFCLLLFGEKCLYEDLKGINDDLLRFILLI